ncbi:branched-chain amino acid ABC transporter permease [Tabrizicola sp. M-4]|uniref:branched-chain amino acid ABC transporter permease n=1 Tax=Tabrizicola sp. M-4 TaxID=3055847 RepID=UPI003DA91983
MTRHFLRTLAVTAPPILALILLAFLIDAFAAPFQVRLAYAFFMNLVLAIGLQIFMGNSGVVSFGHLGFMGVASYTTAILTIPVAMKATMIPFAPFGLAEIVTAPLIAAAVALLVVLVLAFLTGFLVSRLAGAAAEIFTLALLVIAYVVFTAWIDMTRGQRSLYGIPVSSNLGWAVAVACVAIFIARLFRDSDLGLQLRASSEDRLAALSMGVKIGRLRQLAWVISALVTGAAGVLHATYLGAIGPNSFYFSQTFLVMAMVILGGMRSVSGTILGVLAISVGNEAARTLESGPVVLGLDLPEMFGLTGFFLGAVIVATMIWRRDGLMGDAEFETLWRKTTSQGDK